MSRVHQLLAAAAPFDAVTQQALVLDRLLREWGHESRVHAEHVHADLRGRVEPLSRRRDDADAVVLRYSIWSAAVEEWLSVDRSRTRRGLVYHNITPPAFLRGVNPAVASLCSRARAGLADLAGETDAAIADSSYNARELEDAGFTGVRVVPLLLDLPARRPAPPPDGADPVVLSVGRIVPNKRLDVLIRAVALLRDEQEPRARLALVGSADGFEPYLAALQRFARALDPGAVEFAGRVDDAERDRRYREAAVYACASAHEGFCAPLVEAMAVGLPVVAVGAAAVPETLGAGGLVLPDADALVIAEALHEVLTNAALRRTLAAGAERRLRELAPDVVARSLREAVDDLLDAA